MAANGGDRSRKPSVAIVGAGFGGIGAAILLCRAGFDNVTVFERSDRIGGVWQHNTYPGAACDAPSHLYSFSFARNPDWSRRFAPGPEIRAYLERTAREHGVAERIRLGTEVHGARYDMERASWRLDTSDGELEADVLVAACGHLARPYVPAIPGADEFAGTAFHSAEWDHDHDLRGRRVGVIGTGASAIQFVPEIQPLVEHLSVFQRSAPWILGKPDREYGPVRRALNRGFPPAQLASRIGIWSFFEASIPGFIGHPWVTEPFAKLARRHLREQVPDPELRAKLEPNGMIGCKRVLISDDWYPAIQQPNVELVTDRIERITPGGIRLPDGREIDLDTVIWGTGFRSHDFVAPMRIVGRQGTELIESWGEAPRAYLGLSVPAFPNLFLLYGPNTNLGAGSIVHVLESQARHVVAAVETLVRTGAAAIEVKEEAVESFQDELAERQPRTIWLSGCNSWYTDEEGRRDISNWPGLMSEYRRRTARVDPVAYRLAARQGAPAPVGA